MSCKGKCEQYRYRKPTGVQSVHGMYCTGRKRCMRCEIFIEWDGRFCPCCNCRLRTRPQSTARYRQKHQEMMGGIKRY